MLGTPIYAGSFAAMEPFYNGQARVERFDGGLEVIDVKEAPNGELQLFIRYVGACATCSSGGATLFAIEETLRKRLNTDKIRVFPL
jgi:Fe-S cluster biogenesis protein NfuA